MFIFKKINQAFVGLLSSPLKVALICFCFLFFNFVIKGGVFELVQLQKGLKKIKKQNVELQIQIDDLDMKIARASDPDFIELEALKRFNWSKEGDLIFIFSEDKVSQ